MIIYVYKKKRAATGLQGSFLKWLTSLASSTPREMCLDVQYFIEYSPFSLATPVIDEEMLHKL